MNQLADPEMFGTRDPAPPETTGGQDAVAEGSNPLAATTVPESRHNPLNPVGKNNPSPESRFALNARTVVGVAAPSACRAIGDYWAFAQVASGGMATVHVGYGSNNGRRRTVAIKLLKPAYVEDAEFASMFASEARLASRIQHPNVVQTLDFVQAQGELALVMDYVPGEALSKLLVTGYREGKPASPPILRRIFADVLRGLHAAHEAKDGNGNNANIVHRDVSPQNILVGVDGVARVLDFGIALAAGRVSFTRDNEVRGKLSYVAPEQLGDAPIDLRADLYSAAVVLWEALTCKRLFQTDDEATTLARVLNLRVPPPSYYNSGVTSDLDTVVLKGLNRQRELRYQSAWDMARAIAASGPCATRDEVADWVGGVAARKLAERQRLVAAMHGAAIDQPSQYQPNQYRAQRGHSANAAYGAAQPSHSNGSSAPPNDSLGAAPELQTGIGCVSEAPTSDAATSDAAISETASLDTAGSDAGGPDYADAGLLSPETSFSDLPMVSDAQLSLPPHVSRLRRRVHNALVATGTLFGGALLGTVLVLQGANFLEPTIDRSVAAAEPRADIAVTDVAVPAPAHARRTVPEQAASDVNAPQPLQSGKSEAAPKDAVIPIAAPSLGQPEPPSLPAPVSLAQPAAMPKRAGASLPNDGTQGAGVSNKPSPTPSSKGSTIDTRESAPATSTAPNNPAVTCTPPYTMDSSGIKRYKLECL
jgi:eukaryotic-like serine/threonine-protein kinase